MRGDAKIRSADTKRSTFSLKLSGEFNGTPLGVRGRFGAPASGEFKFKLEFADMAKLRLALLLPLGDTGALSICVMVAGLKLRLVRLASGDANVGLVEMVLVLLSL